MTRCTHCLAMSFSTATNGRVIYMMLLQNESKMSNYINIQFFFVFCPTAISFDFRLKSYTFLMPSSLNLKLGLYDKYEDKNITSVSVVLPNVLISQIVTQSNFLLYPEGIYPL